MDAKTEIRTLCRLLGEMALLSGLVVGGGYAILAVADERLSRKRGWVRSGELFEALPLFQMIPGIIGGHVAVYVGRRVAGWRGALVSLVGMALPSMAVFLAVTLAYRGLPLDGAVARAAFLGLRAALTGVLLAVLCRMWRTAVAGVYGYVACGAACAALLGFGLPPAVVIVAGMACGVVREFVRDRRTPAESPRVFRSFWMIPILFLGYGLIAFGGGFVLVPVYLRDFVGAAAPYLQLSAADFANVMALTQMTPGPVAVNCATYFGYGLGGVPGALVATLSVLLPGSVLLYLALRSVARFQANVVLRGVFAGARPVTAALILQATVSFAGMSAWTVTETGWCVSPGGVVLVLLAFLSVRFRWLGSVVVIFLTALVSVAWRVGLKGG